MCARQRETDCVRAPLLFVYVLHRLSGVQKIIITTSNVPMRCHMIKVDEYIFTDLIEKKSSFEIRISLKNVMFHSKYIPLAVLMR